ncbi:MAG: hypothetical protein KH696_05770 [Sutterella sp.]|nr:hypothetical protein [Sutterella sp.]
MKHPSTLYKKLVRGVLLLALIAVALILGNRLGILSHSVKNAGLVILLFVCNMSLALGARHAIERAVWPESWKRGGGGRASGPLFRGASLRGLRHHGSHHRGEGGPGG